MRKQLQIRADEVRSGDQFYSGFGWSTVMGEPLIEAGEVAVFTTLRCEFYRPDQVVTVEREV
jgi:hypothetical protein